MDNQKKKIGLFMCIMTGVGCIIGSGIFGSLPTEINEIGSDIILAFVLATVFETALMIPVMYASAIIPTSGSFFAMSAKLIHPWAGVYIFVDSLLEPAWVALYAVMFSDYFCQLVPAMADKKTMISILLILFFGLLAYFGNYIFASINSIAVVFLVAVVGLYIFYGLSGINAGEVNVQLALSKGLKLNSLAVAINVLSTCLSGASSLTQIADDCKNPRRNIPIGIIVSTLSVSVIYILMSFVTLKYVGDRHITTLSEVATSFMPSSLIVVFIICGPILGVLTSMTPSIMSHTSQMRYMANDKLLPNIFTRENKHGVSVFCLAYVLVFSIACVATGYSFDVLISVVSTLSVLINVPICLFPFEIHRKYPHASNHPGFRINYRLVEILSVVIGLISIYLAYETARSTGMAVWGYLLIYVIVIIVYILFRKRYLSKHGVDLMAEISSPLKQWEDREEECRVLDMAEIEVVNKER